jgi:hypothetical protein
VSARRARRGAARRGAARRAGRRGRRGRRGKERRAAAGRGALGARGPETARAGARPPAALVSRGRGAERRGAARRGLCRDTPKGLPGGKGRARAAHRSRERRGARARAGGPFGCCVWAPWAPMAGARARARVPQRGARGHPFWARAAWRRAQHFAASHLDYPPHPRLIGCQHCCGRVAEEAPAPAPPWAPRRRAEARAVKGKSRRFWWPNALVDATQPSEQAAAAGAALACLHAEPCASTRARLFCVIWAIRGHDPRFGWGSLACGTSAPPPSYPFSPRPGSAWVALGAVRPAALR